MNTLDKAIQIRRVMQEDLYERAIQRKKELIEEYLLSVMTSSPHSYYDSASLIARQIHNLMSQECSKFCHDDQMILQDLSVNDIRVELAFHN